MIGFKPPKKRKQIRITEAGSPISFNDGTTSSPSTQLLSQNQDDKDIEKISERSNHDKLLSKAEKKRKNKKNLKAIGSIMSFAMDNEDNEEDESDDNDRNSRRKNKTKKKDKSKRKHSEKKNTKTGLGFGGTTFLHEDDDDDDNDNDRLGSVVNEKPISGSITRGMMDSKTTLYDSDNSDHNIDQTAHLDSQEVDDSVIGSTSLYGKEALAKLKSEQKLYISNDQSQNENDTIRSTPNENDIPTTTIHSFTTHDDSSNDFIPLKSSITTSPINDNCSSRKIVNGDEALGPLQEDGDDDDDYDSTHRRKNLYSNYAYDAESELDEDKPKPESSKTGIDIMNTTQTPNILGSDTTNTTHNQNISTIKASILNTLTNLKQIDQDLESTISRRRNEFEMTKQDTKAKESELDSIGKSFEYYQTLRTEMVNHIGALRYISSKLDAIEDALKDFWSDVSTRRQVRLKEWEDDIISYLTEQQLLDRVVGRIPNIDLRPNIPTYDEFGRDLKSMDSLTRVKRVQRRKRVRKESRARHLHERPNITHDLDDSDMDVSDNEIMDREERRQAFSDAVEVVLNEMEDCYTSPSALIRLFNDWSENYPEDFKQAYTDLSFIYLLSVHIRSEFCKRLDLMCIMSSSVQDKSWHQMNSFESFDWLKDLSLLRTNKESLSSLIIFKSCVPVFESMLNLVLNNDDTNDVEKYGLFDPFSTKQSEAMSSFFRNVLSYTSKTDNADQRRLSSSLVSYIINYMHQRSTPILKSDYNISNTITTKYNDEEYTDAISYATSGQLMFLNKFIRNIATFWYPFLESKAATEILQFCLIDVIGQRFLPILDLMRNVNDDEGKRLFSCTWKILKEAGWVDNQDLMLYTAPIRAIAAKYGGDIS